MPAFNVRYVQADGKKRKERLFAPDVAYLRNMLQRKKCWPLSIEMVQNKTETFNTKLGFADISAILDQVEMQLDVQINVDDAFRNLSEETPRGKPRFVVQNISDSIDTNGRVAQACRKFPKIFPEHICQVIEVGEDTGKLAQAFRRVIEYFAAADALKSTIITASVYPVIVIVAMIGFIFLIFGFTVPKLMAVFIELGVTLPPLTKAVLAISNFVQGHPLLLGGGFAAIAIGIFYAFKSPKMRPVVDYVLAKGPIIGPITKDICIARFGSNLATLYNSEIPIVQGLTICSKIAGNALYDKAIKITRAAVEQGRPIASGLKQSGMFPSTVVLTVNIGEENGKLGDSLTKIATYHHRKSQEKVERALKFFEPAVLILLVVGCGILAYALLTPMYSMIEEMSKARK